MSDRPYTEAQVFELEMHVDQLAEKAMVPDSRRWQALGQQTIADILYDALIALRQEMSEEREVWDV